jgi:hypothetical protein
LGAFCIVVAAVLVLSRGGQIDGFKSLVVRYPDDRLSVVVLTNADFCTPEVISWQVASLYEPSLPAQFHRASGKKAYSKTPES